MLFLDDLIGTGKQIFTQKIDKLKTIFQIGSENQKAFTNTRIGPKRNQDHLITIDYTASTENIQLIPITKEQIKKVHFKVTEAERLSIRSTTTQLNCLANITRAEISYQVLKISNRITEATISDVKERNKIIKCAKANKDFIIFPPFHIPNTTFTMFSGTSFNKLLDGLGQRGHIVFLVNKIKSCPIS